jgi:hypothetical protein
MHRQNLKPNYEKQKKVIVESRYIGHIDRGLSREMANRCILPCCECRASQPPHDDDNNNDRFEYQSHAAHALFNTTIYIIANTTVRVAPSHPNLHFR